MAGATDAARGASDIVLQEEGLSTIVSALYGSRKIFKRIETYLTYKMCSSFVFGFVFVLIYCASGYNFPTWTLILMSLLNDFAVASSSKDQVAIQRSPQSLDMWKVAATAAVMALASSLQVWGFVHSIINFDGTEDDRHFFGLTPQFGAENFSGCEVAAYTFLVLIITLQFDLIAARSPKPFWYFSTKKDDAGHYIGVPPPSAYVMAAISVSLAIATFVAVYWEDTIIIGSGYGMQGIGWRNAGLTWAWALLWFIATDSVKAVVVAVLNKIEKRRAKGKTWMSFYRNVLTQSWDSEESERERKLHTESLRNRLPSYDVDVSSLRSDSISRRSTFPLALAANLQQALEDEDAGIPLTHQHELLGVQTLQDDPALLRVISEMSHIITELRQQVDDLKSQKDK